MTINEIEARVQEIVTGIVFSNVSATQELLTTHLLDSIGVVDLVVQLENHMGVHFDLQEVTEDKFNTVQKISGEILGKLRSTEK